MSTGYRIDILIMLTGLFAPYAGRKKQPLTKDFAESLRDYLKRQGSCGRMVSLPDEQILEVW